jgi:hypothetical protein
MDAILDSPLPPNTMEIHLDGETSIRGISHWCEDWNCFVPLLAENELLVRSKLGSIYVFTTQEEPL